MRWYREDLARPGRHADWMYRHGRGPWRVVKSRLRLEHPSFFDVPNAQELHERSLETQGRVRQLQKVVNALAATVRELRHEVRSRPAAPRP